MGEEAKLQLEEGAKTEEKRTEEEQKTEENNTKASPCSLPFVLFVDLHCVGCAKKIEKSIINIRGVEGVVVDMAQNQVAIKGIVDPQAICAKIMKKTKRGAKVLSPLPTGEGEPLPELVASQVCEPTTVELYVNMHCEACAQQLETKILKMRAGVQTVATELSSGKVTVTGTMAANKLVEYVYRRTKKQAKILPQPKDQEKPPRSAPEEKEEEKKEENDDEKKKEDNDKEEEHGDPPEEQEREANMKEEGPDGEDNNNNNNNMINVDANKQLQQEELVDNLAFHEENNNNNNIKCSSSPVMYGYYYNNLNYHVIDRIPPPPQLFSDENPNACCIS